MIRKREKQKLERFRYQKWISLPIKIRLGEEKEFISARMIFSFVQVRMRIVLLFTRLVTRERRQFKQQML